MHVQFTILVYPVYFDKPPDSAVNTVMDDNTVQTTSGYEKQQCVVMLTVLADGR